MSTSEVMTNINEMVHAWAQGMRRTPLPNGQAAVEIDQANIAWAQRYGLVTDEVEVARARAIRVGELAASSFARERPELIQLGADLVLWLFLFDDAVGEAPLEQPRRAHRLALLSYERVVRSQRLPRSPSVLHVALRELVSRALALGGTRAWLARFAADVADYHAGCADETDYRRHGQTPSLRQYRCLRARTVGTAQVFALLELGRCGLVSSADMSRPEVIAARELATLLTAWVNDIYSYPKELDSDDPLNLVHVLGAEGSLGINRALQCAVECYNSDLEQLEQMAVSIEASGCSRSLAGYLEGMLAWVHANAAWTGRCGRYRSSVSRAEHPN